MAIIIKTKYVPRPFWAYQIGPFILILPEQADNAPLLAHERTHVAQFWRNPFKRALAPFVKSIRFEQELEAFRVEYKADTTRLNQLAYLFSTNYGFGVDQNEAARFIKDEQ